MSATLHIDWQRCDANGSCVELLPELLTTDDWGYPLARPGSNVPVPDALHPQAQLAVKLCPKLALTLKP